METLEETERFLDEKAEELNFAKSMDRNEMYKLLISYGNELPEFPEELMTEENFVKGCTSNVYIHAGLKDEKISYTGKADAMIVKGYLAILIKALSGLKPEEVLKSESLIERFTETTDVKASLTPSRANAFSNIYRTMKEKAKECAQHPNT
ncbi:MAG: SufE family protein [Candidatus Woesearchaeota archaeon]